LVIHETYRPRSNLFLFQLALKFSANGSFSLLIYKRFIRLGKWLCRKL
jgi:hypothetical protein